MPKLGLGLAGLIDHDADPDGVVLGAVTAPSEPPPPRSSFMFQTIPRYIFTLGSFRLGLIFSTFGV